MAGNNLGFTKNELRILVDFVDSHMFIQMRHDSKEHAGEYAEIVGWRPIEGEVWYTIKFDDGFTVDIPSDLEKMSEICIGSPCPLYVCK